MTEPDLTADLANLETELDELLEERRRQLARPMRGAVRDHLHRQFDRAEERLRARIIEARGRGGRGAAAALDSGK